MSDDIRDQLRRDHESVLAELDALRSDCDEKRCLEMLQRLASKPALSTVIACQVLHRRCKVSVSRFADTVSPAISMPQDTGMTSDTRVVSVDAAFPGAEHSAKAANGRRRFICTSLLRRD